MPIYAYKCESCGFAKDVLQKMSDPLLTDCPACARATFTKQLTAAGFQLKGSGWYATDFKGGNGGAAKATPAEAAGDTSTAPPASTAEPTASKPAVEAVAAAAPVATGGCSGGCACHS